jgi:radical SAM superfamily enzyme YgiQ (UPF0313 family)
MAVIGSFMFGFDTDTRGVFDETFNIIKDLKVDLADFCILTPFPGTPLYKKFDREGRILTKDWSKYTMKNVVFQPKNMTPQELLEGVKRMYVDFYSMNNTITRISRGVKLGFYPFFLILARNALANIHIKLIKA